MFQRQNFLLYILQLAVHENFEPELERLVVFLFFFDDLDDSALFPDVEKISAHGEESVAKFWHRARQFAGRRKIGRLGCVENR